MRIFGVGYRKRVKVHDGEKVEVFMNKDLGIPSFSFKFWKRVTINPTARKGQRVTVFIKPGWSIKF